MKKKIILPIISTTLLSASPLMTAVSCSQDKLVNELLNETIKQFVGENYDGGICHIPHPSRDTTALCDYLIDVIHNAGIKDVIKDLSGNIWYDIPATQGCANWKPLVLQAHMDMIWETVEGYTGPDYPTPVYDVDPNGEPIIHTDGYKTSLGADNGAGLAFILALTVNKNFKHGPIRCIFTTDEELGQIGASQLGIMDGGRQYPLSSRDGFNYLINLDAEDEGQIFASCAGGYSANYPVKSFKTDTFNSTTHHLFKIEITGGMSGHSGVVMIDDPINAPILGAKMLSTIDTIFGLEAYNLVDIQSFEDKGNVVPGRSTFIFALPINSGMGVDNWKSFLKLSADGILSDCHMFHPKETNLDIQVSDIESASYDEKPMLNVSDSSYLVSLLNILKFGAQQTETIEGKKRLVSSSNVCPVELHLTDTFFKGTYENEFNFMIFDRSDDDNYLEEHYIDFTANAYNMFTQRLTKGAEIVGVQEVSHYPAFKYSETDKIRNLVCKGYEKLGIKYSIERTHGGIENGWWYKYNNDIQQTSIGPTIKNVHNPKETLYINTYKSLIKIILDVISQMGSI